MITDFELTLSDAQVLAASGNSTNDIDMTGAIQPGTLLSDLYFILTVSAKSGATPTIRAALVGADDAAFSVNKVTVADTGVLADPVTIGTRFPIALGNLAAKKRYYRIEYTLGGTTPGFTVTATLTPTPSTGFYPGQYVS